MIFLIVNCRQHIKIEIKISNGYISDLCISGQIAVLSKVFDLSFSAHWKFLSLYMNIL